MFDFNKDGETDAFDIFAAYNINDEEEIIDPDDDDFTDDDDQEL